MCLRLPQPLMCSRTADPCAAHSQIEQAYPQLPRSTHFRIVSLMILLMAIDAGFVYLSVSQTLEKGASVLLLFAFEVWTTSPFLLARLPL